MNELTGFQRDLLYCIAGTNDPYGLQIGRELENYTSTEVNHGRLYPNLNTLVEKGLVKKQSKDDRTNLYTLTDLAIDHIEERRQWENDKLQHLNITADTE
jgi:DNA-binding PadR family transcriptional regulator